MRLYKVKLVRNPSQVDSITEMHYAKQAYCIDLLCHDRVLKHWNFAVFKKLTICQVKNTYQSTGGRCFSTTVSQLLSSDFYLKLAMGVSCSTVLLQHCALSGKIFAVWENKHFATTIYLEEYKV